MKPFRLGVVLSGAAGAVLLQAAAIAQATWSAAAIAPAGTGWPQLCFAAAEGRILATCRRDPMPELETWERDATGWFRRQPAQAPSARSSYVLVYDSARRVAVVFGGVSALGSVLGDTWEWNGIDWLQRTTPVAPAPRYSAAAAFDRARGRLVLHGGALLADQWEWDGAVWSPVALATPNPGRRSGALMTYDAARNTLVLFGGFDGTNLAPPRQDTWEYAGSSWSLRPTPSPPPRLLGAAMSYDEHGGRTVLVGGRDVGTPQSPINTDAWLWDGAQWQQQPALVNPGLRSGPGFAYDAAARRFVLHGHAATTDTWELDPATWSWSRAGYTASRSLLALAANDFAGHTLVTSFYETLRWDHGSRSWQDVTTPTRPNPTSGAMAYDVARQQAVLFNPAGETWIWDDVGATWQQRMPLHSPPPTQFAAMAYDIARGRTVLYGGVISSGVTGDLFEWDGLDWTPVLATGPGARLGAAMAYDLGSGTIAMFGGVRSFSTTAFENDVWDWNGSAWSQRSMVGPQPTGRYSAALLADGSRVRMFGGQVLPTVSGGMSEELWELQGSSWVQLPSSPLACRGPIAALDPTAGELALFGGIVNAPTGSSATPGVWIFGLPRARVTPYGAGCTGSGTARALAATGLPTTGNASFALTVPAASNELAAFALGLAARRVDLFGDCSLLVDTPTIAAMAGSPAGTASLAMPIPAGNTFLGLAILVQAAVLDPVGANVSLSGGLELGLGR
ncbi:MAG: hypothetical protein KDE27_24435 [Planctomycetes bacterium]|nr:hypothetical protein [Planctomycetota bacterium]